jgi:hypothetical protein
MDPAGGHPKPLGLPHTQVATPMHYKHLHADLLKHHHIITYDYPTRALVMNQKIRRISKAHPAWEGPYIVVRKTTGGAYILKDTQSEELSHRVPGNQLRLVSLEGTCRRIPLRSRRSSIIGDAPSYASIW